MDDSTATIVNVGGTILVLIVPMGVILMLARIIWESLNGGRSGKRMMENIREREVEKQKRTAR